jgi:hypothetical protein
MQRMWDRVPISIVAENQNEDGNVSNPYSHYWRCCHYYEQFIVLSCYYEL